MTRPDLFNKITKSLQINGTEKPWIVQKFGGTSIGKYAEKIAEDVVSCVPSALAHVGN
jgi:aspartokinase